VKRQSLLKFLLLTTTALFLANDATAQTIPFIKRDQIVRWKTAKSDSIIVINFWATWCAPCVAELPAFEKLNKKYKAKNVAVVLVSTDFKKQVESKLAPFVKKKKLKSQVVFMDEATPNHWVNMVSTDWSGAIPATLMVSQKTGKYLFFEKQLNYSELEAAVLSIL
jgi:thiol-disulfide isomerase/thioredoxin